MRATSWTAGLCIVLAVCWAPSVLHGEELRRSMPYVRPLLMGNAHVAVADEASSLLYNPAGLARLAESSYQILTVQLNADEDMSALLLNGEELEYDYSDLTALELLALVGTSLHAEAIVQVPIVVKSGSGVFGLAVDALVDYEVVALDGTVALEVESFVDYQVISGLFGNLGKYFSWGANLRLISRNGVHKVIDALTLYAGGGATADLENDEDYLEFVNGRIHNRAAIDLGIIFRIPGSTNWQPRFGLSAINLGGYRSGTGFIGVEFGERPTADDPPVAGELPLNYAIGFAVSPTYGIVRYTFALDMVDLTRTAIGGDSWNNRTRVGFEAAVAPNPDGTALFSLLFGWNATHFGAGVLSRIYFMEIGFGNYIVERGTSIGENPDSRSVLIVGFRF